MSAQFYTNVWEVYNMYKLLDYPKHCSECVNLAVDFYKREDDWHVA